MKRLKCLIMTFFMIMASSLFAISMDELLNGYVNNSTDLKELLIILEQQQLALEKNDLGQAVSFSVSTGTVNVDFDENADFFSITPELYLDLPFMNTELTATATASEHELKKASLELKNALISSENDKYALEREKKLRNIDMALKDVENKFTELKTKFLNEVKDLYSHAAAISSAEDDVIEKKAALELVVAQGYAPNSATYRTKEMAVKSAEWTVEDNKRVYQSSLEEFLLDCEFDPTSLDTLPELPDYMVHEELLSIADFDHATYKQLDESLWAADYNERYRASDKDFTLSTALGYTYTVPQVVSIVENTASLGLSADWSGLSFNAGLSIPFENPVNPKLQLGVSFDYSTFRLESLDDKEITLEQQLDTLEIEKAHDSLKRQMQTSLSEEKTLAWQKVKCQEEFDLFNQLYKDTQEWYSSGLVSYLDLLQAKTDYEGSLIKLNEALLNIVIYNLELSQLFLSENK